MGLGKAYLVAYNLFLFFGWAVALAQALQHVLIDKGGLTSAYGGAGQTVGESAGRGFVGIWLLAAFRSSTSVLPHAALFQLISGLEIGHGAAGLVGGSPALAAMQWAGRSNVLFGVVWAVPEVQVGQMLA